MGDAWRTDDSGALFDAILRLESRSEAEAFFRDLCTLGELRDMSQRWAVVRLLDGGADDGGGAGAQRSGIDGGGREARGVPVEFDRCGGFGHATAPDSSSCRHDSTKAAT